MSSSRAPVDEGPAPAVSITRRDRPIRLLQIAPFPVLPLSAGGKIRIVKLARALCAAGVEVTIVAPFHPSKRRALAEREPPCAVDTGAERSVDDELHAARLVEEALEDDAALCRHLSDRRDLRLDVRESLSRTVLGQTGAGR